MKKVLFLGIVASLLLSSTSILADQWDPPEDYYQNVTGSGTLLKSQLTAAMSNGHTQRSYGDFRYSAAISDRDPDNSSKILLCYNYASVNSAWDSGNTWNREHVWPQSKQPGSASNSTRGNLGDPHALRPCNNSINSNRGNMPFGGEYLTGSYRKYGSYFFPGDRDKGNIARSLFYSAVRYSSLGLTLANGTGGTNTMGDLKSLLHWHYMDPPDEFERRRNHTIYSKSYNPSYYTNNRNAFVDHPEYAWSVFGGNDNDTCIYLGNSHNSDGSSEISVNIGTVTIGSGDSLGEVEIVINKTGDDGTYYNITASENASYILNSEYKVFDYGTQSTSIIVSVINIPTEPGIYSETITIDNLDVCGNSPAGCGSNDANDVITIQYSVVAPLQSDLTNDGYVDIEDLSLLAESWLTIAPEINIEDNGSDIANIINLTDLSILATEWANQ